MQFQQGNKAAEGKGRTKKSWIADRIRMKESKASFQMLLDIRNGMVLERKVIGKKDDGKPIEVDVVASIKDLIICCKEILDRTVGKSSQEIDLKSKEGLTVLVQAFDPDADDAQKKP